MKRIFWGLVFVCICCSVGVARGVEADGVSCRRSYQQDSTQWKVLPAVEFEKILRGGGVRLIDVRTPQEFQTGYIPGAENINVKDAGFKESVRKLDVNIPVAVYCRSGVRSRMAAELLSGMGFKVYELEKGINSWTGELKRMPAAVK